jgi:hypothetical protein
MVDSLMNGPTPFIGKFDFNWFQNPDAKRTLNLRAALRFIVREGLGHLVADVRD